MAGVPNHVALIVVVGSPQHEAGINAGNPRRGLMPRKLAIARRARALINGDVKWPLS